MNQPLAGYAPAPLTAPNLAPTVFGGVSDTLSANRPLPHPQKIETLEDLRRSSPV